MWFKKKAKIPGFTDSNYNGTDYRLINTNFTSTSVTHGKPTNLNDYFYLPALGSYDRGTALNVGIYGLYWSSTPHPWTNPNAHSLCFGSGSVDVSYSYGGRYCGHGLWRAE